MAQTQVFTPQMQQALAMLQAPAMELRALVQKELAQNPVLEEDQDGPPETDAPAAMPDPSDALVDRQIAMLREIDEDTRAYFSRERSGHRATAEDEERRQYFFDSLSSETTLADHLGGQLRLSTSDPELLRAGEEIVGNLDEEGFLRAPVAEIAAGCGLAEARVEEALHLIQTFDPVGVGARDLRECLLIQLDRLGRSETIESAIVQGHFDALAHHRYDQIARALGVDGGRVRRAAAVIAELDPRPGRKFAPEQREMVVQPEIFIFRDEGEWKVAVSGDAIPRLRISNTYKDLLATEGKEDELRSYLKEKIRAGKSLIHSIQQRHQTIQKIAEEVVRRQIDFFESGPALLKPLTLAQVGAMTGVHETTVSRAISGKYASTPWGVFDMKYFFTPGYQTESGEMFSNKTVKDAIRDLIAGENKKKPHSDEDIVAILAGRGLKLARRTVAKYRAELHILPSSIRRES